MVTREVPSTWCKHISNEHSMNEYEIENEKAIRMPRKKSLRKRLNNYKN